MSNFIQLGSHRIEVCSSSGMRFVKHSDLKKLLNIEYKFIDAFIGANVLTDTLFKKIYIDKTATKEQEIIYKGLCIVGLYSLIDEACKIDLKTVSYLEEFNNLLKDKNNG